MSALRRISQAPACIHALRLTTGRRVSSRAKILCTARPVQSADNVVQRRDRHINTDALRQIYAPSSGKPLTEEEFDQLMESFKLRPRSDKVVVAVSGGPDSMALAVLLADYCKRRKISLLAVTIDHKLREESSTEAKTVSEVLRSHGVPHYTYEMLWNDSIPDGSKIQSIARRKRYEMLANICEYFGSRHLFVAHNADDQLETVLFRFGRASGISGLSGMSKMKHMLSNFTICRPLLSVSKERLVATCSERSLAYAVDRSNFNADYDRVRCRLALSEMNKTIPHADFQQLVDIIQRTKEDIQTEVNSCISNTAKLYPTLGVILWNVIQLQKQQTYSDIVQRWAISRILTAAGGKLTSVPSDTVSGVLQYFNKIIHDGDGACHLKESQYVAHGCYVKVPHLPAKLRKKQGCGVDSLPHSVMVLRNLPQRVPPPIVPLQPRNTVLFDARFRITAFQSSDSKPRNSGNDAIRLRLHATLLPAGAWLYLLHLYPELQTQIAAPLHVLETLPVVCMQRVDASDADCSVCVSPSAMAAAHQLTGTTSTHDNAVSTNTHGTNAADTYIEPAKLVDEMTMLRLNKRVSIFPPVPPPSTSSSLHVYNNTFTPPTTVIRDGQCVGFQYATLPAKEWQRAVRLHGWWLPSIHKPTHTPGTLLPWRIAGGHPQYIAITEADKRVAESVVVVPAAVMSLIRGVWVKSVSVLPIQLMMEQQ